MEKLDEYISENVFIFADKVIDIEKILRMTTRYYKERKNGKKYVLCIDYAGHSTNINFKHYNNMETVYKGIKEMIINSKNDV